MFDFKDTAVFMSKAATYYILNEMDFSKQKFCCVGPCLQIQRFPLSVNIQ